MNLHRSFFFFFPLNFRNIQYKVLCCTCHLFLWFSPSTSQLMKLSECTSASSLVRWQHTFLHQHIFLKQNKKKVYNVKKAILKLEWCLKKKIRTGNHLQVNKSEHANNRQLVKFSKNIQQTIWLTYVCNKHIHSWSHSRFL